MSEHRESRQQALRDAVKGMSMVLRLGVTALCPILLLILVGLKLDMKYGNGHHWFTLAGALCGVYSAYRGTWQMIRGTFGEKKAPDTEKKE